MLTRAKYNVKLKKNLNNIYKSFLYIARYTFFKYRELPFFLASNIPFSNQIPPNQVHFNLINTFTYIHKKPKNKT